VGATATTCAGGAGWDWAGSGKGVVDATGFAGACREPAAAKPAGLARGRGTALAGGFAGACGDVGVAAGFGSCCDVTAFGGLGALLTVGAFAVDATGTEAAPALDGIGDGFRRGTGGGAEAGRTAGAAEAAGAVAGATDGLPFVTSTRTSMRCPHLRHFRQTVSPTILSSAIWYFALHCSQRNFTSSPARRNVSREADVESSNAEASTAARSAARARTSHLVQARRRRGSIHRVPRRFA
jgi:hypothetical protein